MYVTGLSAVKLLDYVDMEFWILVWSMTNIPNELFHKFQARLYTYTTHLILFFNFDLD